jgi:predicted nucleic acid-binding protein
MTARVFVDTNVFVYAQQPQEEPLKQPLAAEWLQRVWSDGSGRISVQVLNECYSAATKKSSPLMPQEAAKIYVAWLLAWKPHPVDATVVMRAMVIEARYRLNWWDCLIVAAAQIQGCGILLTEDLDHHGIYGGVKVHNPFRLAVQDAA